MIMVKVKLLFLSIASIINVTVQAQHPDIIKISFPDTVRTHTDCILKINLLKRNSQEFLFPEKYIIGEDDGMSDLTIIIEKLNENKFSYYRCNKSPFAIPILDTDSVIFTRQKSVQIIDSLEALICIERGYFRMRLEYRTADGSPISKTRLISRSNWVKFYVDNQQIILSSYARMRLEGR
jgi:hypothetical protein